MVGKYIGIIGGSGLYNMDGVEIEEERMIETPFGNPSDKFLLGKLDETPVAFLPRHGRGHRISPSEINYRANIYAFKTLGVDQIFSVTAVGSMKEGIQPGNVVIADQFIDRTRSRPYTFFEDGIVAHVAFADPICRTLANILNNTSKDIGTTIHKDGTYVCIEGPAFSTRAESNLFRSWGVHVIGMTCYQEARLAREAEICYATMAMATDYDCWHVEAGDVNVPAILEVMRKNVSTAQKMIRAAVPKAFAHKEKCRCNKALENAILTDHAAISAATRERLKPLIEKYMK